MTCAGHQTRMTRCWM